MGDERTNKVILGSRKVVAYPHCGVSAATGNKVFLQVLLQGNAVDQRFLPTQSSNHSANIRSLTDDTDVIWSQHTVKLLKCKLHLVEDG